MASSEAVPNSDIVFRRHGTGDYAAVFSHGFLDDQYVWNPLIDQLTASDFETVTFDLPGFGERADACGPFTYDRFAADVAAVVDALGKPFVLVGHSMSGPIVELVAASRPDAIGLILLAPAPMGGFRLPEQVIEQLRSLGQLGTDELEAVRRQLAPAAPEAELKRLARVGAKLRPEVVRTVADMFNNGYPGGAGASAFKGPVLLLRGGSDETVTHELLASAVTARFGPEATVGEIDGAHHWSHLERSAAVAAQIDRFLALTTAEAGVASVAWGRE
ncbi:MAG TPA: alpha/beta hydrolase [Solirubrobacteraceae bacterium]|jgi:pimeloyl-ACP methyl ester carboxylesterase|nr:alpha/beta hydrolase [Solirubrobacteraceae bacterium]